MEPGMGERMLTTGHYLLFEATQSEPDLVRIGCEYGAQLSDAALNWETDFSITSAAYSTPVSRLAHNDYRTVVMLIPPEEVELVEHDGAGVPTAIQVPEDLRLNCSISRLGVTSEWTVASTKSGSGSKCVRDVLMHNGNSQIPMTYKSNPAHVACIGIFNARVIYSDSQQEHNVQVGFTPRSQILNEQLELAESNLEKYASDALEMAERVVYKPLPMLTKSVFKTTVGVNAQGARTRVEPCQSVLGHPVRLP
jgi:hypothetical protein